MLFSPRGSSLPDRPRAGSPSVHRDQLVPFPYNNRSFTVGGNLSRGAVQIVGEIDIDHGQTGGTTAGETDDAITVGLVAPALVPLQEQRHLSNENIGSKIDGPSQIICLLG